jgi:AcrR family transcriptional regulator
VERKGTRRDLRRELLAAAVAGGRSRGRNGVVLREAARATGVSATAAYRHFDGYDDLLAAVCQAAGDALYASMVKEIARDEAAGLSGAALAYARLRATGRGYVLFAVTERGLFECLASTSLPLPDTPRHAFGLLSEALDGCVVAGLLPPRDREGAEALCWIAVHGLAMQAVQGILPADGPEFEALLDRTLDFVARGLGIVPPAMA